MAPHLFISFSLSPLSGWMNLDPLYVSPFSYKVNT